MRHVFQISELYAEDEIANEREGNPILKRIWHEYLAEKATHWATKDEPASPAVASLPAASVQPWTITSKGHYEKAAGWPVSAMRIHGIASSSTINSHGYALIAHGMEAVLPVPLLSSHKGHSSPIGECYYVRKSDTRVYVRAALHDNEAGRFAWDLIQRGELRCFSGAGKNCKVQGIVDGKTFYGAWALSEVSICRQGANPDSIFEILRPGDDGEKFFSPDISKSLDEPRLPYRGVWRSDEAYMPGDYVTHSGSLWHGNIESKGLRPGDGNLGWTMAVKSGQAKKLEQAGR